MRYLALGVCAVLIATIFLVFISPTHALAATLFDNTGGGFDDSTNGGGMTIDFTATGSGTLTDFFQPVRGWTGGGASGSNVIQLTLQHYVSGSFVSTGCVSTSQTATAWGIVHFGNLALPIEHTPVIDFNGWSGGSCAIVSGDRYFISSSYSSIYVSPGVVGTGITGYGYAIVQDNSIPPSSSITLTSPTANFDYANNPIVFSGTYTNIDTFNEVDFSITNTSLGINVYIPPIALPTTNVVNAPWAATTSLAYEGLYTVQVRLYDTVNATSTAYTTLIYFGLGSTTTVASSTTLVQAQCSFGDFICYIEQGLQWAFYPSQGALQLVASDWSQMKTRPPLGNMLSDITALQTLSATGTPTFALAEDWPIMHYIFQPIADGAVALVWFVFALGLFRRSRHIEL